MTYFGALKGLSRAEARRRSGEWLERVELPHVAGWKIDRLSKGMSQKVQIAAVLLSDPELCVLDEPTTGLDPVNVRLVQDLLLERRRNGRTTILSTHQMNQVEALCDRIAMINRGQLMVYGEVDEVRRHHSLPEVRVHARGPLPAVPAVASVIDDGGGVVATDAGGRECAVGRALDARGCRRRHRPVRADARTDGRHLSEGRARRGGLGDEDGLAQDLDDRDLRVPDRGPASRLPDHDLRHAAVHGGVWRGRGDPGLLRQPQRARTGGLWRRRSWQRAEAAERSPRGVAAAA